MQYSHLKIASGLANLTISCRNGMIEVSVVYGRLKPLDAESVDGSDHNFAGIQVD